MDFCHLHLHSEMSLLDGMSRLTEIPRYVKELGMRHVALTDHGVLYGAVDFWKACREEGVHPVLGVEAYLARGRRDEREARRGENAYHLLLLAEDMTGWQNLMRLVSIGFLEGFYYRPRIDREVLERYGAGLVVTTGCLSGEIPSLLLRGDAAGAEAAFRWYLERFGRERFYVELMDHGLPEEKTVGARLVELARKYGVRMIVTQDAHYLRPEDAEAHDVLLAIQTGKALGDPTRLRYPNQAFYVTSPQEMYHRFAGLEDALRETVRLAERLQVEFRFGDVLLPAVDLPPGVTPEAALRQLCYERLYERYPSPDDTVRDRLEHELSVISRMGFASYFLIVFDFVDYARRQGIAVGPGRGSAAGSLVAYVLGITDVDPLRYGLIFERFLNPERVTMPDMDIDFEYHRRGEVIQYVTERYGPDRVSQIITFGTLAARAALRDVARAMELPYAEADRLAKLVPAELGITLDKALERSRELYGLYEARGDVRRVVDVARALEGLPRHASVHAAGVLIAPRPLLELVPLQKMPDGTVVTQFPMGTLEELGLLKMDFLGLRTLTIIEETRGLAARDGLHVPRRAELPLDDEKTYALLQEGDTLGVFQLESPGMREMLRELRPECIEDVMAAVSLYRPGPMEHIPLFVDAKRSGQVAYLHPDLEPILQNTYGVMVYQEQILQIAHRMAGYSLGEADLLRRAIAKKKADVLRAERERFLRGVEAQGYTRALGEELFDWILKFANYGFNKAHGAAYGLLAYETAYLKAHVPAHYLAATLSVLSDAEKIMTYVHGFAQRGVVVLAPDINRSLVRTTVEAGKVRLGLHVVKGLGEEAASRIVAEREAGGPYRSLADFVRRLQPNRRLLEPLVKAGTFDGLHDRRRLLAQWETILEENRRPALAAGGLFHFELPPDPELLPLPAADAEALLAAEREALGFYLTAHPIDPYAERLRSLGARFPSELGPELDGQEVDIAGVCTSVRQVRTSRGEEMAFAVLSDRTHDLELVVFPKVYRQTRGILHPDRPLLVRGRLERPLEDGGWQCVVTTLAPGWPVPTLWLRVEPTADRESLQKLLKAFPGPSPVVVRRGGTVHMLGATWRVDAQNPLLREGLERLLGREAVQVAEEEPAHWAKRLPP